MDGVAGVVWRGGVAGLGDRIECCGMFGVDGSDNVAKTDYINIKVIDTSE